MFLTWWICFILKQRKIHLFYDFFHLFPPSLLPFLPSLLSLSFFSLFLPPFLSSFLSELLTRSNNFSDIIYSYKTHITLRNLRQSPSSQFSRLFILSTWKFAEKECIYKFYKCLYHKKRMYEMAIKVYSVLSRIQDWVIYFRYSK